MPIKDTLTLDIKVNGEQGSATYRDLLAHARALRGELLGLKPGTEDFIKKSAELKKVNSRLATIREDTKGVRSGMEDIYIAGLRIPGVFRKWLPALGAAAIIGGITRIGRSLINSSREALRLFDTQDKVSAQTKAVLESTRGAAGRTFQELKQQAQDLQQVTLFGDEQTQEAQNILLTFTKIREEIYDRSVPAVLDMATALKLDLKSASIQVGKALNDPVLGVTALGRAGVQFTEDQKATIKTLVETNRVAEAQTIILEELETQFKGSAQAAAQAGSGGLQQLQNRYNDIREVFGDFVNRLLIKASPIISKSLDLLERFADSMLSLIGPTNRQSSAVRRQQSEFNSLVGVLLNANISQEKRSDIINKLNTRYKEYLPNLIDEKASHDEIKKSVDAANVAFAKRIQLLSAQELLQNISDRQAKAKLESDKLLIQQEDARLKLEQRADRARGIIYKNDSAAQAASRAAIAYQEASKKVEENIKLQQDLQAEYEKTAEVLGVDDLLATNPELPKPKDTTPDPDPEPPKPKETEEDKIQKRIKAKELEAQRLEAIETVAYNRGEIAEEEYQERIKQIRLNSYNEQLEILKEFREAQGGQDPTLQELQLQVKVSELEKKTPSDIDPFELVYGFKPEILDQVIQFRNDMIEAGLQEEEILLRTKLNEGILAEEDFQLKMLELRLKGYEDRLDVMRNANLVETEEFRNLMISKLELEKQYQDSRTEQQSENTERNQLFLDEIATQTSDTFGQLADIIQEDYRAHKVSTEKKFDDLVESGELTEKQADKLQRKELERRKKALSITKAFQIADTKIRLFSEIGGIWENAQKNPLNSLIPGWGTAFAAIQTAFALARSQVRIRNIASQQFDGGGGIPKFPAKRGGRIKGPDHDNGGVKFRTPSGFMGEARGGEIILNEDQQRRAGGDAFFREIGVPLGNRYNDGGVVPLPSPSTTPSPVVGGQRSDNSGNVSIDLDSLVMAIQSMHNTLRSWPTKTKAYVSYTEIQEKQQAVEDIKAIANA